MDGNHADFFSFSSLNINASKLSRNAKRMKWSECESTGQRRADHPFKILNAPKGGFMRIKYHKNYIVKMSSMRRACTDEGEEGAREIELTVDKGGASHYCVFISIN